MGPRGGARTGAGLLAGLCWAGAPSAPAGASEQASIAHVQSTRGELHLLVTVPPDAEVDLAGVTVTIDGNPADATAALADATTSLTSNTGALAVIFGMGLPSVAAIYLHAVPKLLRRVPAA